jgi:uncharacterized membrane protein
LIDNLLWLLLGYVSFLELRKIIEKHFGSFQSYDLIIPCTLFTLLGGITTIVTILIWLVLEWDGKLKLNLNENWRK